jgi:hypothetical protein
VAGAFAGSALGETVFTGALLLTAALGAVDLGGTALGGAGLAAGLAGARFATFTLALDGTLAGLFFAGADLAGALATGAFLVGALTVFLGAGFAVDFAGTAGVFGDVLAFAVDLATALSLDLDAVLLPAIPFWGFALDLVVAIAAPSVFWSIHVHAVS